ncbi:MAG: carbohydrate ABC transporter permease [Anaerolineae bacterium]|nr:carbohydrate ABC transporter permease [Anaerolineae bacterium]
MRYSAAAYGARFRRRVFARVGSVLLHLALTAVSLLAVLPLLHMLSVSLQTMPQILQGTGMIPNPPTLQPYVDVLTRMPFVRYLKNTLTITCWAAVGAFVSNTIGAYGFARFRFPARDAIFTLLLTSMMLPGVVRLVPTYILFQKLGWLNTFLPLIVPSYFGSPFFVFLLRQFFRGLPSDLFDAARIDGANELVTLTRIVLPLAKPALATMLIFSAQGSWNDFMGPLLYLKDARLRTLALGLYAFRSEPQGVPSWNNLMAIAVLMVLPVLGLFIAFQTYFIGGITFTGIKG